MLVLLKNKYSKRTIAVDPSEISVIHSTGNSHSDYPAIHFKFKDNTVFKWILPQELSNGEIDKVLLEILTTINGPVKGL